MSNNSNRTATTDPHFLLAPAQPDEGPFNPWLEFDEMELDDFALDVRDRAMQGKPRIWGKPGWSQAYVRLVDHHINPAEQELRRGGGRRSDNDVADRLIEGLSESKTLDGPSTAHQVDELAAALFELAPNFAPMLNAIRGSALGHLRNGARWFQTKPILVEAAPGQGKTRLAHLLAEKSGLPLIYLDCSLMTTTTSLISADGIWHSARPSDLMEALATRAVANQLVVVDELDKLSDHSRHALPNATEKLVGLLEPRGAAAHQDQFLQLNVNLTFLNWILICNDLSRIAAPVKDRCIVIRLPPMSASEIAAIASRELERRNLPEELLPPLIAAVENGTLTSLRQLHRALDAAEASLPRSWLN